MTRDNIIILPVHLPYAEECQRDEPSDSERLFVAAMLGFVAGMLCTAGLAYVWSLFL